MGLESLKEDQVAFVKKRDTRSEGFKLSSPTNALPEKVIFDFRRKRELLKVGKN